MFKRENIVLWGMLGFIFIYTIFGNPKSQTWSGFYFIALHSTLLFAFLNHKNKTISRFNIALQLSIIIFVIAKFFLGLSYYRAYSVIPFLIIITLVWQLEKKNTKKWGK